MRKAKLLGIPVTICLGLIGAGHAEARDRASLVPHGWSVGRVLVEGRTHSHPHRVATLEGGSGVRELTVQRRFEATRDLFFDGTISYGDVRLFNPVPSIDSGRQMPYGLDGIGGYGSDYGTSAGQDAALYDRGP